MPQPGFTPIDEAVDKWGRYRGWWYDRVKAGDLTGYKIPGERVTYLRDDEVEAYLKPKPMQRGDSDGDATKSS